jgi:hypothetical protein
MKNLFGLLRKPEWEHANPERRARAVARSEEPDLLARLGELAQTDPAAAVRCAALARLDELPLLERRLRGEREPEVAEAARRRLNHLLSGHSPPPGAEALVGQLLDDPLLQRLAVEAADPTIRRAALQRIDRPTLWAERCQNDADPALRLWALQRIGDADALRRIADAVRKRDKRLARAARERLDAMGLAANDPEALRRRALELSQQFGQLARSLPDDREARLLSLLSDWAALRERLDGDLQRRIDGAQAMAEAALAGARGELPKRSESAPPAPEPDVPAQPEAADPLAPLHALRARLPTPEQADALAVLDRIEAELAALQADPPAAEVRRLREAIETRRREVRRRAEEARRAAQAEAWRNAAADYSAALDAGHPVPAREARERCAPLAGSAALQRELAALDARLAELERWQRWAGSKARQRLCDEVAALAGSGLHPDALATRLRELQDEWARLDAIDGEAAPGAEHGLNKRFRALCARAIAPAKAYFAKRDSLRRERAESVAELLSRCATLPSGNALRELRRDVGAALRALDDVPPTRRGEYGRRLRERLQAIDRAQAAEHEAAVLDKRRLLARLKRDLGAAAAPTRIALAKSAQAEWKALPRAGRKAEDALWAELRELVDPLFSAEQARSSEREAQQSEQRAAAQAILDELNSLASAADERLLHAPAHLEQLAARWRTLPTEEAAPAARRPGHDGRDARPAPRRSAHPWQPRYDRALAEVEAAMARVRQRRADAGIEALLQAGALLDALDAADGEDATALRERIGGLALSAEDRAALQARIEGKASAELDADSAERLVVQAELLAGVDSPAHSTELRRSLQMQRLARRLQGESEAPPPEALPTLLRELQARPLSDHSQRETLLRRWQAAWAALPS